MSGVRINKYRVEAVRTKEQKDDFIRWLIARVDEMPRSIEYARLAMDRTKHRHRQKRPPGAIQF